MVSNEAGGLTAGTGRLTGGAAAGHVCRLTRGSVTTVKRRFQNTRKEVIFVYVWRLEFANDPFFS